MAPLDWQINLHLTAIVNGASKGQCRNPNIFPPLLLSINSDQNIFFSETCFAYTITEPEFTVFGVRNCLLIKSSQLFPNYL